MCPGATDFQELKLPARVKADQWSWPSPGLLLTLPRVVPDFSPGWEGTKGMDASGAQSSWLLVVRPWQCFCSK